MFYLYVLVRIAIIYEIMIVTSINILQIRLQSLRTKFYV